MDMHFKYLCYYIMIKPFTLKGSIINSSLNKKLYNLPFNFVTEKLRYIIK